MATINTRNAKVREESTAAPSASAMSSIGKAVSASAAGTKPISQSITNYDSAGSSQRPISGSTGSRPASSGTSLGASVGSSGGTNSGQSSAGTATPNRTMPEGFTGSTTVSGGTTQSAQEIIDKMNANSQAWWTANDADREALHAENEYLSSLLSQYGVGSIGYDDATGRWTGTAINGDTMLDPYTPSQLPSATNQGESINAYYDAAKEAALAAMKDSYDQSLLAIDAAAEKIPGIYQAQMNQVAAQDAVSRANFNEAAAASGLNTGARGQAELASNVALQGNLSQLQTAQANALADVEQQRLSVQTQYQNAIAEAIANNELDRAQALYQEAIRVDESIVNTALNQATENYKAWQSQYQTSSDFINRYMSNQDMDYQKAFTNAQLLAEYGDFSGYKALGFTDEQINRMYQVWAMENPYMAAALGGGTGSVGTGSGGGGYTGGYTGGSSGGSYGGSTSGSTSGGGTVNTNENYQRIYSQVSNSGLTQNQKEQTLQNAYVEGMITAEEANSIGNKLGVDTSWLMG